MLHKTAGISLGYIKFKETSIIARIYTKEFGLQSYIVNSVRSSKSRGKIALFQPLTLLDLVVYKNDQKKIQRISEMKCNHPFFEIPYNQTKTSLAIFITEVISKVTKEHHEDHELFNYLEQSIKALDNSTNKNTDFHLIFLYRLLLLLGIAPENLISLVDIAKEHISSNNKVSIGLTALIKLNDNIPSDWHTNWTKNNEERSQLLSLFISYYQHYFNNFNNLKSIDILHEVLNA